MSKHVDEHISRCIELYGQVGMEDVELRKKSVDRSSYEQMRSDLMVAIGMLMATVPKAPENTSRSAFQGGELTRKAAGNMGRYDELDEAQWYALRVVPQKEYTVAWMLERRDVWAYVPTGTTWRRRTRYAKAGAEYAHPERPGLIFARFTAPPAWYNVLKNHLILGALGRNGEPWQFRPRELYAYFARVPNGTLVHEDGEAVVKVNGRSLRAPTTQTRFISKHRKGRTETVVEPTRQEAELLTGLLAQNASPQLLRAAA